MREFAIVMLGATLIVGLYVEDRISGREQRVIVLQPGQVCTVPYEGPVECSPAPTETQP